MINICFMGTPKFALDTLKALDENEDINVKLVVTAQDKKRNRNKVTPTIIKEYALEKNIECVTPKSVNNDEFIEFLDSKEIDFIVVVAFGQLIGKKLLEKYPDRIINLHPSDLPKYRGASPIQYTLLNGEETTKATTMLIEKGMDSGDILLQREQEILKDDDFESLSLKLSKLGGEMMVDTLLDFDNLYKNRQKQDDSKATFTNKITKEEGLINWNENGDDIINKWRAFKQFPKVYFNYNDKNIKIDDLKFEKLSNTNPGFVRYKKDKIGIDCKDGVIIIGKIQIPGKKMIDSKSFLLGHSLDMEFID